MSETAATDSPIETPQTQEGSTTPEEPVEV